MASGRTAGQRAVGAVEEIENRILTIRNCRVMLDSSLAELYGVPTKRLNERVRRNIQRFPPDFAFQMNREEYISLRSQIATLEQGRGRHRKYLPWVFTEHGAIMAANILNSSRAVQMSVFVVRAFVRMRGLLMDTRDLARKLALLEKELKNRMDIHESAIVTILQRVMDVIDPPVRPDPPRRRIGFHPPGSD